MAPTQCPFHSTSLVRALTLCVHPSTIPRWLGQNSKQGKLSRQLGEVQIRMRLKVSGDKTEIRQHYLPALYPYIVKPLMDDGSVGLVPSCPLEQVIFTLRDRSRPLGRSSSAWTHTISRAKTGIRSSSSVWTTTRRRSCSKRLPRRPRRRLRKSTSCVCASVWCRLSVCVCQVQCDRSSDPVS